MSCSLDLRTKINPFFSKFPCDFITTVGVNTEQMLTFLCRRVLGSFREYTAGVIRAGRLDEGEKGLLTNQSMGAECSQEGAQL